MRTYYELMNEDPFMAMPVTFHIKTGSSDPEFKMFTDYYELCQMKIDEGRAAASSNIWIIKPGEDTNQGDGIHVAQNYSEIETRVTPKSETTRRTYIL